MPGLVMLGFFLLILPGLFLSLCPTAFLWGCIFAAFWWLTRAYVGDWPAAGAALVLTAALLLAIPYPARQSGELLYRASLLPETAPEAPLRPTGDIRLETPTPRWDQKDRDDRHRPRALACDNLCLALLFSPGVTSVTVNRTRDFAVRDHREGTGPLHEAARTFRLVPRARCGDRAVDVDLGGTGGLFGANLAENRAIAAEWNLRLATEYCVVAGPALDRFDMLIRQGRYTLPDGKRSFVGNWKLAHGSADVDYAEIRDGAGTVLLRRLNSHVIVPARPLHIAASGGIENFRFHWGRETLSNHGRWPELSLVKLLGEATTLGGRAPSADLVPLIRTQLKAALADPAATGDDRRFRTLETWFAGIAPRPLSGEDLALVTALVLDDRLTDYRGFWELKKLPDAQRREIGRAIVLRLLAAEDPLALRRTPFSPYLYASLQGAFATLGDDEQALLAAPGRRIAAAGLVARLSDGGAAHVPILLDILRYHARAWAAEREAARDRRNRGALGSKRIEAHSAMIAAARLALCRAGPAASAALPEVEAMIADGTIAPRFLEGHGGTDWNLTLARLGKPLGALAKPARLSGTDEQHRRNLERRLARFDPDRSCGRI